MAGVSIDNGQFQTNEEHNDDNDDNGVAKELSAAAKQLRQHGKVTPGERPPTSEFVIAVWQLQDEKEDLFQACSRGDVKSPGYSSATTTLLRGIEAVERKREAVFAEFKTIDPATYELIVIKEGVAKQMLETLLGRCTIEIGVF
ncbi:hypothetical protein MMC25_007654 [Agyrium rufum]|nr:hypothetical protein [Agyrium rufum]